MGLSLYKNFPALEERFPHCSLVSTPTPLQKLENLGKIVGHDNLWIKRDDLTSEVYGGNKARKLDFILARAGRKGAAAIATSGGRGSHHVLATCMFGVKLGFDVGAIQFPVPIDSHLSRNQQRIDEAARWKVDLRSSLLVPYGCYSWKKQRRKEGFRYEELMIIPPGGSSPLGCLGYLNAALEIESQRNELGIDPFDFVYTALGTCGTFCGLSLGFQMAKVPTCVVGVQVATHLLANRLTAAYLIRRTRNMLEGCAPLCREGVFKGKAKTGLNINKNYFGRGYAIYTRAEREIMELLEREEGIVLDPVYTAKAMRAFLDHARKPEAKFQKLLFTLTCDNGISEKGLK